MLSDGAVVQKVMVGLMSSETSSLSLERPLALRQPGWLAAGAGATSGAMVAGAAIAAPALAIGVAFSPLLPVGAAGFFLVTHVAGLALAGKEKVSSTSWMAGAMSLGHALLLVAFIFAAFQPGVMRGALSPVVGERIFTLFGTEGNFIFTFGPIFLSSMLAFSILAPVSLMIFRYIAFRK